MPIEIGGVYLIGALLGSLVAEPFTRSWSRSVLVSERPDPGIVIEAALLSTAIRLRASRALIVFVGAVVPFGIVLWSVREFLQLTSIIVVGPRLWSGFWYEQACYLTVALPGGWLAAAWAVFRRGHSIPSRASPVVER